jgi:ribosomal protein S18 acetylase RimI-like enzyme
VNLRSAGAARSLVVRPGSDGSGLVHVRLRDDSIVPEVDDLREWLDTVASDSLTPTTVRTAALYPRAAARFEAAGFAVADRLVLLRADLTDAGVLAIAAGHGDRSTRTLRRHQFGTAAAIDRAAFGEPWGHDAAELAEICRATPIHAARYRGSTRRRLSIGPRTEPVAFAIAGASSEHGYLQRLAVDPQVQRRGHGRELTTDALRWMIRRRLPDCLVNTSVDNATALGLYRSLGFSPMDELLTVLQFEIRPA